MTNHYDREEQIFAEAVRLCSPTEQRQYVANACGADRQLYGDVCALLEHHAESNRILDRTAYHPQPGHLPGGPRSEVTRALDDELLRDATIGSYRLQQRIGEGGMGVVYMAEQSSPVQRQVALKIIKLGMDTKNVIARFEAERQALAMMDHPCITKILAAGATDSGRPYFVMDLVRGTSITDYCDQHRVTIHDRLRLMIQVCGAIQHAHQKGIIHRDLKPSNVMVTMHDGVPVPKVIDFGIAKAINQRLTQKTLFTNYADMIGTPQYMSPEQAEFSELDVDTRSDIYSLGVMLYELLTGDNPFSDLQSPQNSLRELHDAIRAVEPELPSTRVGRLDETGRHICESRASDPAGLVRSIRGELDWIIMKCLAKDRTERYGTVAELARDLQRYLNGEPVEAAAPSWWYRGRKLFRKHRPAFLLGTAMAGSLAIGIVVSTVAAVDARQQARRANRAEKLASQRLDQVVSERDRAIRAEAELTRINRTKRRKAALSRASSRYFAEVSQVYRARFSRLANERQQQGTASEQTIRLPELPRQQGNPRPAPVTSAWLPEGALKPVPAQQHQSELKSHGTPAVRAAIGQTHRSELPARSGSALLLPTVVEEPLAVVNLKVAAAAERGEQAGSMVLYSFTTNMPPGSDEQAWAALRLDPTDAANQQHLVGQRRLFALSVEELREEFGTNDPFVAEYLLLLGHAQSAAEQSAAAVDSYREALLILERIDQPDTAEFHHWAALFLARGLRQTGKTIDARHVLSGIGSIDATVMPEAFHSQWQHERQQIR